MLKPIHQLFNRNSSWASKGSVHKFIQHVTNLFICTPALVRPFLRNASDTVQKFIQILLHVMKPRTILPFVATLRRYSDS
jgi:hypothetical protein